MNYEELLEYLDLDGPEEFQYFEVMADLIECEDYIDQESVFALFDGADREMIAQLTDDYFEEITKGLPEDSDEIFMLLDQIRLCLSGLAANAEDESDIRLLTDEFCRFRDWYSFDSQVELLPEEEGPAAVMCLRDAITTARIEKLGGEKYRYNYENALDYELDSYTMSFAELVAAEDEEDEPGTVQ
ncbi:MAG: hypothetical protein MJ161_03955 [Clostridia bacterium]|nr:hypothetical protein [Clostridia bacterium]